MISILWFAFYTLIYLAIGYGLFALIFRTWQREPNVPHEDVADVAAEYGTTTGFLYGLTRALLTVFWPAYIVAVLVISVRLYRKERRENNG